MRCEICGKQPRGIRAGEREDHETPLALRRLLPLLVLPPRPSVRPNEENPDSFSASAANREASHGPVFPAALVCHPNVFDFGLRSRDRLEWMAKYIESLTQSIAGRNSALPVNSGFLSRRNPPFLGAAVKASIPRR